MTQVMRPTKSGLTGVRMEAIVVIAAILYFVGSVVILHLLRADVAPLREPMSYFGRGQYSLLFDTAVIVVGAAGVVLAFALYQTTRPGRSKIAPGLGMCLLAIWGITEILVAMFPIDLPGETATLNGTVHGYLGYSFVLIVAAALLIGRAFSGDTYRGTFARSAAWAAAAMLVLSVLLVVFNGFLQPVGIGGLVQRLFWLAWLLWLGMTAVRMLIAPPRHPSN
jgi:hypothetical protein